MELKRVMRGSHLLLATVIAATTTGCNDGPFSYVQVSGKISYDDGELIPAKSMRLVFVSLAETEDPNIRPRPADAGVDVSTGEFGCPISQRPGDGIVPGQHKVIVTPMDERGAPVPLIPAEYADAAKTPLIVDTADSPFDLRIPKPESASTLSPRKLRPTDRVK